MDFDLFDKKMRVFEESLDQTIVLAIQLKIAKRMF